MSDRPDPNAANGVDKTPKLDALALFKEGRPPSAVSAGAAKLADAGAATAPVRVAGADSPTGGDATFNAKRPDTVPAKFATLITPEGAKPLETPDGYVRITGNPAAIDKTKPTVAIVDIDKSVDPGSLKFDSLSLYHSDVTAIPAAITGYNALVLRETPGAMLEDMNNTLQDHRSYFAPMLKDIARGIIDNSVPLGPGDVINFSIGNNVLKQGDHYLRDSGDPTYTDLNAKFAKLKVDGKPIPKITPDNLLASRDTILKGLEQIAKDSKDPKWQKIAKDAIGSAAALKAIETMGVEVTHAAGNNGNDRVDLDFLFSTHQLASVDPATQKPDHLSNYGKFTEPYNGVLEVRRQAPGMYQIGDVTVSASDICAVEENNCGIHITDPGLHFNGGPVDRLGLLSNYTYQLGRSFPPSDAPNGHLVAVAAGTSFSINGFLEANLKRLTEIKELANKP